MPLSEEEILLTIMNEQQERDKKNNPKSAAEVQYLEQLSL